MAEVDWPAMEKHLSWSRKFWIRMPHVFRRDQAVTWVSGFSIKVMVQVVLFFIAETWVVTLRMVRFLWGFISRWQDF